MRALTFTDPAAFLAVAEPWLLERITENNLVLGIATTARSQPGVYGGRLWFALVTQGDTPLLAALRTAPRPAVLSVGEARAVPTLVDALRQHQPDNPGVIGPTDLARSLATTWCGDTWSQAMAMRAYELTTILPDPRRPTGTLRPVRVDERPQLTRWIEGFRRDAHLRDTAPAIETARHMMAAARAWFFEVDGVAVAVATVSGSSDLPGAARIGMVYTPPEHRCKGYGSAATAALAARLLAGDTRACFLFTDLANPTSNAIYQRIGFEPVCDYEDLLFSEPFGVQ